MRTCRFEISIRDWLCSTHDHRKMPKSLQHFLKVYLKQKAGTHLKKIPSSNSHLPSYLWSHLWFNSCLGSWGQQTLELHELRQTHTTMSPRHTQNNGTFLAVPNLIPETSWRQLLWYMIGSPCVRCGADCTLWIWDDSQTNVSTVSSCRHLLLITVSGFIYVALRLARKDRGVVNAGKVKHQTFMM